MRECRSASPCLNLSMSLQAPSSPAELSTPMLSSDSMPGSERLLRERVYSTGDFNQNSVGRTISTLSAMSEDSADSSGSDADPVREVDLFWSLQVLCNICSALMRGSMTAKARSHLSHWQCCAV